MKKIYFLLLPLLVFCLVSYAKVVAVTDAKTVGYNYLVQRGISSLGSINDLQLVYTSGSAPVCFYVFGGSNCFVIVSADDAVRPVLGYSADHVFGTSHIPASISGFLDKYSAQINYVVANKGVATTEIATSWGNLLANKSPGTAAKTTTVSPLLTTTWDQYPYYNYDCPADTTYAAYTGGYCVTGCVATAMTQVMKYWNWPNTGVGFNSYLSFYGVLSANFAGTTYNWAAMPNSVISPNAAVATLMYHAGVSVDMNYTAIESGAQILGNPITSSAEFALKTYFKYNTSLHGESRVNYTDTVWTGMLKAELDAGRPVIYGGTGPEGGHCFDFDGYDNLGNFHVNWGWSGNDNGYFTIDALSPANVGAGGGAGDFNSDEVAIFNIKPDTSGAVSYIGLASDVSHSPTTIFYTQGFTINTSIVNAGTSTFTGTIGAMIVNSSGQLVDSITIIDTIAAGDTAAINLSTLGLLSMLPGTYNVFVAYHYAGSDWNSPASDGFSNPTSILVYNHNFIELYDTMLTSPSPLLRNAPASVTLNVANMSGSEYTGAYGLSLYYLDGTHACTIQTMTATPLPSGDTYPSDLTFSTTDVNVPPGTYFMALEFSIDTNTYLAGTDYHQNPIYVNVQDSALLPDIYEPDDNPVSAFNLTPNLNWVFNQTSAATTGSNFHVVTDQDYYKLVLPAGYNYSISARVDDEFSSSNNNTYSTDAIWSYSTNGGTTWSAVYDDVMPGTINLNGAVGGTVLFHVSPHYLGITGTYLFEISNITRTIPNGITTVQLSEAKIYPNPAKETVTIDLTGTGAYASQARVLDMQGRVVYTVDLNNASTITIPVSSLAEGLYFVEVKTDGGTLNRKIVVSK